MCLRVDRYEVFAALSSLYAAFYIIDKGEASIMCPRRALCFETELRTDKAILSSSRRLSCYWKKLDANGVISTLSTQDELPLLLLP
eukprot:scaffold33608_cov169-Skeletonema_dohrnii-CCMP3373.AAC.4